MDKASEMGKTTATGTLQLFLGQAGWSVIMAVGTIVMSLFILEGDYGLYAVSIIPVTTALLFQDWGVGSALIRRCAQCRASKTEGDLRRIIVVGLAFETVTGLMLTLMVLLMANFLAFSVFNKPEATILLIFSSFSILSLSVFGAVKSVFVGFERMGLTSYVMVLQALVQAFVGPFLVYLHFGALGAVFGYILAAAVAGSVSLLLMYFMIYRKLPPSSNASSFSKTLRPMLSYGVPLGVAMVLSGIGGQFFSFLMARFSANDVIGNYRVALNFGVLISFLTVPLSIVLFPAFSKIDVQKEKELLRKVFMISAKYSAFLLVPATLAMIVLSHTFVVTLYGSKWSMTPYFLSLITLGNLLAIVGNYSVVGLFTASGETKLLLKLNLLTLFIGIPLAIVLIPQFGVVGAIVCSLVSGLPSALLGLYFVWKYYGARVDFKSSGKILLSSATAAMAVYLLLSVFTVANWERLGAGAILFLVVYIVVSPLVGAVDKNDIRSLRLMFSGFGVISRILEAPLMIMERIPSLQKIDDEPKE
jgi:O-antigen/teichoic acid export membrane protein